jgi:GDPmannose 4,6-dehydratase
MTKIAFITGITGQDGSYLSEYLLEKGYEVHGIVRRSSSLERSRLSHLYSNAKIYNRRLFLHYADLDDSTTLRRILHRVRPHELYHLAGQSHVGLSFEIPETTCEFTAMGTLRLLEIVRDLPEPPRLFHATSSEIFGRPSLSPQTEDTPMAPVNPYGCAKAFATQMVKVYRDAHNLFAVNGILYNHESPRRGENFVTRKICRAAAAIKLGLQQELVLGDTTAQRDWGHACDYVHGMWLSLAHDKADDYIFATGELHSVHNVIEIAFEVLDLEWHDFLRHDSRFFRPTEPLHLVGDATKAYEILNWTSKVSFFDLITEMTLAELSRLSVSS